MPTTSERRLGNVVVATDSHDDNEVYFINQAINESVLSLISSWDSCQRLSISKTSDTSYRMFHPVHLS